MTTPKTLQEALALVPEYILLRPEEKSIDGDEFFNDQPDAWQVIEPCHILSDYLPRRRPIHADVREAWAVIAMYEANQLPEYPVPAIAKAVSIAGKWLLQGGRND
ncbi:MAG: hypothetical protein E6Q97_16695 [Desulfurellales bacterium]|nr:MAG: hypothetical protein E6Q97_16695 [Desulfurellales bacterium]